MKTKSKINAALNAIKQTTRYNLKQISVELIDGSIYVYSIDEYGDKRDVFYATEIILIDEIIIIR